MQGSDAGEFETPIGLEIERQQLIATGGLAVAVALITGLALASSRPRRQRTGNPAVDAAIDEAQEQIDRGRAF